jgi:hypothetical protein
VRAAETLPLQTDSWPALARRPGREAIRPSALAQSSAELFSLLALRTFPVELSNVPEIKFTGVRTSCTFIAVAIRDAISKCCRAPAASPRSASSFPTATCNSAMALGSPMEVASCRRRANSVAVRFGVRNGALRENRANSKSNRIRLGSSVDASQSRFRSSREFEASPRSNTSTASSSWRAGSTARAERTSSSAALRSPTLCAAFTLSICADGAMLTSLRRAESISSSSRCVGGPAERCTPYRSVNLPLGGLCNRLVMNALRRSA